VGVLGGFDGVVVGDTDDALMSGGVLLTWRHTL
jgi:hypothetical protein